MHRLGVVALSWLRALDIVLCTLWLTPLYLIGLADQPTGTQMISAYVGEAAFNGQRWAKRMARVIDTLAILVGDKPEHCYRIFTYYRLAEPR